MRAVIAAAGTGGHINPGIAIANKIMEKEPNSEIVFIGTGRGLEKDLVPRAGYKLETIDAYGINRKINIDNVKRLYKTIKSIGQAKEILRRFKPDVVIGTGGYICVSVGKAAQKLKIPVILHESNAFPGVAVKLLAKKSKKVLVGFEDTKLRLPKNANVVVTGTPSKIKKGELSNDEKINKRKENNLKIDMPLVLVFGGSQGARSINEALLGIIENKLNKDYQIIWAAGQSNYPNLKKELLEKKIDIDKILVVTFTNAAAAEMRERILDAIYKKMEENPEDKNLQKQIILLNKASICTIDSFCLDIIKNNFYEIDVSANTRIADNTEVTLLKQEVLDDLFEEKYIANDNSFIDLIKCLLIPWIF